MLEKYIHVVFHQAGKNLTSSGDIFVIMSLFGWVSDESTLKWQLK